MQCWAYIITGAKEIDDNYIGGPIERECLTSRSNSSLFLVPPTTPIAAVSSSMEATKMIIVAGVIRTSLIAWYGRFILITHTPITSISNPTI